MLSKFVIFIPLIMMGCTTINSTSRQEKERVEVSMHKIRTDLEEIKHDLNTHQMELHILEGKLVNHDDSISILKEETFDEYATMLKTLEEKTSQLDKKIDRMEKKQTEILQDFKKYQDHSKEMYMALTEYKSKFLELEKFMRQQNNVIKEMKQVKDDLTSLLDTKGSYIVKAGDSLEKIAKKHQISIEMLKKANHMQSDLIVVGQELVIPNQENH
ncbi:MAG: LysM peptidoglycan-binding domain-containing protein [Chlamydiales bacterium]|nr:LysM peptidoglycan-binding domain-containing protein [Chlamydiales bacterium]